MTIIRINGVVWTEAQLRRLYRFQLLAGQGA